MVGHNIFCVYIQKLQAAVARNFWMEMVKKILVAPDNFFMFSIQDY
jgi:hypothetical protein